MTNTTNPMNHDEKPSGLGQPVRGPVERVEAMASSQREIAQDAASCVAHTAEGAASYVGQKADDAAAAMGSGLKSLGHAVREHAPLSGMAGEASTAVANTLENTGRHLQKEGLKGIADDVTNLIRRNPIPALLVGLGVGFLIARATTRRS